MGEYSLLSHQVPDPPDTRLWDDNLRWALMVADPGSSDLKWASFLLTAYLKAGKLSTKQAEVGNEVLQRLYDRFADRELWCQAGGPRRQEGQGVLRLVHSDGGDAA